jgi:hypothetical protein
MISTYGAMVVRARCAGPRGRHLRPLTPSLQEGVVIAPEPSAPLSCLQGFLG